MLRDADDRPPGTDVPDVVRADGSVGEAPEGAFFAPTVLGFADATTPAVHEIEAFGPVASIIEYSSVADAAELVGRELLACVHADSRVSVAQRVRENVELMRQPIPAGFWQALKQDGILPEAAPVPGG